MRPCRSSLACRAWRPQRVTRERDFLPGTTTPSSRCRRLRLRPARDALRRALLLLRPSGAQLARLVASLRRAVQLASLAARASAMRCFSTACVCASLPGGDVGLGALLLRLVDAEISVADRRRRGALPLPTPTARCLATLRFELLSAGFRAGWLELLLVWNAAWTGPPAAGAVRLLRVRVVFVKLFARCAASAANRASSGATSCFFVRLAPRFFVCPAPRFLVGPALRFGLSVWIQIFLERHQLLRLKGPRSDALVVLSSTGSVVLLEVAVRESLSPERNSTRAPSRPPWAQGSATGTAGRPRGGRWRWRSGW